MTKEEILNHAFRLISSLEGLRTVAYRDGKLPNGLPRYSIGYGNISYFGEVITIDEAKQRCKAYIEKSYNYFKRMGYNLINDPFCVAMLSKCYQYGDGILKYYNGKSLNEQLIEFTNDNVEHEKKRRKTEIEYYQSIANNNDLNVIAFLFFCITSIFIIIKMVKS